MIDLLKDEFGDMQITAADVVVGFSDQQHRADLLLIEKGELKHAPQVGVGTWHFLEGEDVAGLFREINLQFSADGMDVKKIMVATDGKLFVEAPYKQQ